MPRSIWSKVRRYTCAFSRITTQVLAAWCCVLPVAACTTYAVQISNTSNPSAGTVFQVGDSYQYLAQPASGCSALANTAVTESQSIDGGSFNMLKLAVATLPPNQPPPSIRSNRVPDLHCQSLLAGRRH